MQVVQSDITTLADKVFENLCSAIVDGEIPPGSKISEPDLANRLKVSRASIREAIGRLEACSLVTRKANIGARVVQLRSDQLLEIYHVREALEGMAARLAARFMTAGEVDDLRALVTQHARQLKQDGDGRHFQQVGDLDFHYRIVQGSHNSRLIDLLCNDLYYLVRMYRQQFGMRGHRFGDVFREHQAIVDVIAAGDGEMAELMMRRHIRASREDLERLLEQSETGENQISTSDNPSFNEEK
jgi:DNA-binding GntR family transcriptional regulator